MSHHTAQLLEELTRKTENFLQKAVSEWQMLPGEVLSTPPAPGTWSAAQCIEHLNIYGRYYLPAMEKAIQRANRSGSRAAGRFRPGWLGAYFTRLMQPLADGQVKTRMKAPKNAVPSAQPDARAMVAEFIDQQEMLLKLLGAAASVNLDDVRIPISIAPWIRLKLGDTFLFLTAHIQRHMMQAERAIREANRADRQLLSAH